VIAMVRSLNANALCGLLPARRGPHHARPERDPHQSRHDHSPLRIEADIQRSRVHEVPALSVA
jgi:hypothetical protein